MKGFRKITHYLITGFVIGVISCSGFDPLSEFQQNETYEYKLFGILDDYPSLYAIVESLDQYVINDYLAQAVGRKPANYITSTNVRNETIRDIEQPIQKSLQGVKAIVQRVIEQDQLMRDWHEEETTHAENLYALIETVRDANLDIEHDLVSVLRAKRNYMLDVFTPEFLTELTDDEIDVIDDPYTALVMDHSQKSAAKTTLQCDYSLWLDSGGNVRGNKGAINEISDTNLGLGNLVRGSVAKLMALNAIIRKRNVRDYVYELIREYGRLSTAMIGGTDRGLAAIVKDYMLATESYFTIGGKDYETLTDTLTSGYSFKIYGGPVDPNNAGNANIFSNAEARQISLSTNPVSMAMMIRSDREGSLISPVDPNKRVTDADYEDESNKHYLLDKLLLNLRGIGFNPESAHLEESIYDLIRFDMHGRDRKTASTDADAWSVSFLESLLFLSGAAQNTGWTDGGGTSERNSNASPMNSHGHGISREILSFNDALFSMGVLETCTIGICKSVYDSAFPTNDRVSRSSTAAFTSGNRLAYRFNYDQNYPIQSFMVGQSAGEMGIPGGNKTGFNEYRPETPDSLGDRNMTRWTYYNIVRACWHGEGPYYYAPSNAPSITDDLDGTGSKLWHVYYRPNGLIYAYVHKANPDDSMTWVYLAPADGHDIEDTSTGQIGDGRGRRQRVNRFKHIWFSDYYMLYTRTPFQLGDFGEEWGYVVPRNKFDNSISGSNAITTTRSATTAGRFVFYEILQPDRFNTRECASPEEALYRNFVWAMNEKKFITIIPLSLHVNACGSNSYGAGFKIVEANGAAGLTSARRYFQGSSMNHTWIMRGNTGNSLGISDIPGDYRQCIFWYEGYKGVVTPAVTLDLSWTSTLWGTSSPPVVSHAAPAISRFAFPRFSLLRSLFHGGVNNASVNFSLTMGSGPDWFQADENDLNWNRRNGLLPVFVTLLGTLWDFQNRNFANETYRDRALKNFQTFAQNLVTSISPRFYYLRKNTAAANYMKGTWVPRIRGGALQGGNSLPGSPSNTNGIPHHLRMHVNSWQVSGSISGNNRGGWDVTSVGNVNTYPEAAFGGIAQRTFFQPEPMRTMINRLYDSDFRDISAGGSGDRRCDGLLALITEYDVSLPRGDSNEPKTRMLTGVFNILMALAGEDFDDPPGLDYADPDFDAHYEEWGARRKLFYALEQNATGNRGTMGHVAQLIGDKPPYGIIFPSWMFVVGESIDGNGEYTGYTNVREDEPVLDDDLRISIGYDDSWNPDNDPDFGIGLAAVDEWTETDWDIFTKLLVMSGELSSDRGMTGGKYNITETIISILERCITNVNPSNDQIKAMVHTKGILNAYHDGEWRYPDDMKKIALDYARRSLEIGRGREYESGLFSRELLIGGGLMEYVLTTADTDYTAREIISDLYRFLDDPLVSNPSSQFWNDIAEMSEGQIELIERGMGMDPATYYENIGYQYNGPLMYSGEIDYYGDLGRVFSR